MKDESTMRFLCFLVVLICLTACGKPHIRLANRSAVPMENVIVRFPSQTESYGTIPPNSATPYREIQKAYSYAYIEATVNGRKAVLQPIDFVGEKLLGGGKYTYALTANEQAETEHQRLRLEFIRD